MAIMKIRILVIVYHVYNFKFWIPIAAAVPSDEGAEQRMQQARDTAQQSFQVQVIRNVLYCILFFLLGLCCSKFLSCYRNMTTLHSGLCYCKSMSCVCRL